MSTGGTFEEWLQNYKAFRQRMVPKLKRNLPTEVSELQKEQQDGPAHEWEAVEHQALAEYYAREAVDKKIKERAQRVWALSHSKGMVEVIRSRKISVAQALKLLRP